MKYINLTVLLLSLSASVLSAQSWTGGASPDNSLSNNGNWTGTFDFPGSPGFADAHVNYNGTTGTLGVGEEFRVGETLAYQFRITEGALLVNGGTLQANGNISLSSNGPTGDSTLTFMSGSISTVNTTQGLLMSNNVGFNSTFDQSGGTANFSALFAQPDSGGTGTTATVNVSGGNFNVIGFTTAAPKNAADTFAINATGGTMHITRQIIIDQSVNHNGTTELNIDGGLVRVDQGFATQNSGGSSKLDVNFTSGTLQTRATFAGNTFAAHNGTFTVNSGGAKTIELTTNALSNMNLADITLNDTLNLSNQSTGGFDIVQSGSWSGTGGVNVTQGTLLMTGSFDSTGQVTVQSGASLQGNTSFDGNVVVQGNLTTGGASVGVMVFGEDLTFEAGSSLDMDIAGATSGFFERLIGDGANTLILDGILNLDNTGYTATIGDSITIFSSWDTIAGSFDTINGTDLGGGLFWDTNNLSINGSMTVVPEPQTFAILLGTMALALSLSRRRLVR